VNPEFKVIRIETNAQNLYGWVALSNTDQPIGHIFMQEELDNKVKFIDAWVHEDFRRQGSFCFFMGNPMGICKRKF
jgi:hypothetical protein